MVSAKRTRKGRSVVTRGGGVGAGLRQAAEDSLAVCYLTLPL
jgi:hypothetical protein